MTESTLTPEQRSEVGKFIADEIRSIAEGLEELPLHLMPMSAETIQAMQQIDLDRQRLFDLCKMMENVLDPSASKGVLEGAKLERTQSAFEEYVKLAVA